MVLLCHTKTQKNDAKRKEDTRRLSEKKKDNDADTATLLIESIKKIIGKRTERKLKPQLKSGEILNTAETKCYSVNTG